MKKNIRGLNYKFFKNTILLSSLGICAACNNNTVNKHNQENVKTSTPSENDNETYANNKNHAGERENNNFVVTLEDKKIHIEQDNEKEKVENLTLLKNFNSVRAKFLKAGHFLEINNFDNLYVSKDCLVFKILPNDMVVLVCIDKDLENVVVPEKVRIEGKTYFVTRIGNSAFMRWENIKYVNLPSSISYIGRGAFENCTNLQSILIPRKVSEIEDGAFENCTNLQSISIPNEITKIGLYAFQNCTSLESISIPNGIKRIYAGTFWGCISLKSISLPSYTHQIDDDAFRNCENLELERLPDSITDIGENAFMGCLKLKLTSLPRNLFRIKKCAFKDTGIEKITLPKILGELGDAAFEAPFIKKISQGENTWITDENINRAYGNQWDRVEEERIWDSLFREGVWILSPGLLDIKNYYY